MSLSRFDTQNPEQLIYNNSLLVLTVLGGIKLDGLDRMRTTLKAELPDSPKPPIRHNLDLYNDNQLEKFIRKTAERLEVGTSVVAASLAELTAELESYRLHLIKEQQPESVRQKPLTAAEIEEAKNYLAADHLLQRTQNDLQKTGIIQEENNSMILYLAMTSRKCSDPLSVICMASSGTGKSYLMEKVANCFPAEDQLENTQFTENSFYYFKREELRGKVVLIEDLDGAEHVLYPIRELQSKKRISKTVTVKDKNGHLKTVSLIVEGPVSVIGCTTKENIYEDNSNRSLLIYLDASKEQDQHILSYQKNSRAGLIDTEAEKQIRVTLQNAQRILEPVKIINPYAPLIDLPDAVFKPRRTMGLFLSFIEAITFYHQYQREQKADEETGEIYIETTPEDIAQAFELLRETLFRKSDELSGACRSFYEYLITWSQNIITPVVTAEIEIKTDKSKTTNKKKAAGFYASEIRKSNRIHPRTLNRYLQELTEYHYLKIAGGNKHKTGYLYQFNHAFKQENLKTEIDSQIALVVEKIRQAHEQRIMSKTKKKASKTMLDKNTIVQLKSLKDTI